MNSFPLRRRKQGLVSTTGRIDSLRVYIEQWHADYTYRAQYGWAYDVIFSATETAVMESEIHTQSDHIEYTVGR